MPLLTCSTRFSEVFANGHAFETHFEREVERLPPAGVSHFTIYAGRIVRGAYRIAAGCWIAVSD
jgi:hypothetical protein